MKKACFFSNETKELLLKEQYSLQDIRILKELGFDLCIATNFQEIPWNCDVYFSWWASGSIYPLIKALLCRKKIVVVAGGNEAQFTLDSVTNEAIGYLASPWYKKLATKITLRLSNKVMVVSDFMLKDVVSLGALKPCVVHNSIDTDIFTPGEEKKEFITTVFRVDKGTVRTKRAVNFILSIPDVIARFPKIKFLVIGGKGDAYQDLVALLHKLEIEDHIVFLGSMKNEDVVSWMQKSFIYTQVSDVETFGVAIAEAMSCATPVVVSNRGAIPEVVGADGIYVDHNSPKSIAIGLIKVLEMSEAERKNLGLRLRSRVVENFSYAKRKAKIKKIIEDVLYL